MDLKQIDMMETSMEKLEKKFEYADKNNCFEDMANEIHDCFLELKKQGKANTSDWNNLFNKYIFGE